MTSIWGIKGSLLSLLSSQLMVTCCFGACWFGILISPKIEWIGILRGAMIESQTTGPQTNNYITRKPPQKKKKHFLVPGSFLGQTRCVFCTQKKLAKNVLGRKIWCKAHNLNGGRGFYISFLFRGLKIGPGFFKASRKKKRKKPIGNKKLKL